MVIYKEHLLNCGGDLMLSVTPKYVASLIEGVSWVEGHLNRKTSVDSGTRILGELQYFTCLQIPK